MFFFIEVYDIYVIYITVSDTSSMIINLKSDEAKSKQNRLSRITIGWSKQMNWTNLHLNSTIKVTCTWTHGQTPINRLRIQFYKNHQNELWGYLVSFGILQMNGQRLYRSVVNVIKMLPYIALDCAGLRKILANSNFIKNPIPKHFAYRR